MRVLLKANLDTEKGNDAIRSGKLPQVIQELMENIQPEAAYFTTESGMRTMFLFFDLKDPSQMPAIAEPLFFQLGAKVDYTPVMNAEDVQKGLAQLKIS